MFQTCSVSQKWFEIGPTPSKFSYSLLEMMAALNLVRWPKQLSNFGELSKSALQIWLLSDSQKSPSRLLKTKSSSKHSILLNYLLRSGFILKLIRTYIPQRSWKKWEEFEKKRFQFLKKKIDSETDTKIEPSFRFPIPKPNFGLTLPQAMSVFKILQFPLIFLWNQDNFVPASQKLHDLTDISVSILVAFTFGEAVQP